MRKLISIFLALTMIFTMSSFAFAGSSVTGDEALNAALKDAGLKKSEVRALQVDYDDDDNTYEVEFIRKSNKAEYEYEISAATGKIREKAVDYSYKRSKSKKKIGKTAAMKKVAKFSGISLKTIKKGTIKYEYDDRQGKYEIKFRHNGRRYEYDVQASTGKIMEYGWKLIKN